MQRSLEQQVGLEEGRLAAVALRSKCRKLESESLFADVFEKYEKEIRQLQVQCLISFAGACYVHVNKSLLQPVHTGYDYSRGHMLQ